MFYQNILSEISPYFARVTALHSFGEHRHADVEILYCVKGRLDAVIDKKNCTLREGEALFISPMVSHFFVDNDDKDRRVLAVVLGVSFLKKYFSYFSQPQKEMYVITPRGEFGSREKLLSILAETAELCQLKEDRNDLLVRGNLYRICSYLIELIGDPSEPEREKNKEMIKVANIEKALEMIYYDYASALTLEDAATVTGYGKSNFCKIFKSITGDTFHNVLNRQRVESACSLLAETDLSISQIAVQVGFEEAKAFCRVFKSVTSQTPGQYRKAKVTLRS